MPPQAEYSDRLLTLFPDQISPRQPFALGGNVIASFCHFFRRGDEPLPCSVCFHRSCFFGGSFPRFKEVMDGFALHNMMDQVFRQDGLELLRIKTKPKVGTKNQSLKLP